MNFKDFKEKYEKVPVEHYTHKVGEHPIVSVCVQTYNHEPYIKDCLEGILMQKMDSPYEILLGEDASKDGTREICIEYAKNYPAKIQLFLHQRENNISVGSQPTGRFNLLYNLYNAKGKYIALCEGDDYWTDPLKLQKQVNLLEKKRNVVLSFHKVEVFSNKSEESKLFNHLEERHYTAREIYSTWTVPTATVLFRNNNEISIPEWVCYTDIYLFLKLLKGGKAYCHDFYGSVYRRHEEGLSGNLATDMAIRLYYQYLNMEKEFPELKEISKRKANMYLDHLIYAPYFKGIWKYRFMKMMREPKLIFSSFFTTTLTSYMFKRKRHNESG